LHIWLGGMFVPEAYITATRQFVAQANNWSLEELTLEVTVIRVDICIQLCQLTLSENLRKDRKVLWVIYF